MPAPIVLELLKFDLAPPEDVCEAGLQIAQMLIVPPRRDGVTFAGEVTVPQSATPIESSSP